MNISNETIQKLCKIYTIGFYDNYVNEVPAVNAISLYIGWNLETGLFIGKTIKAKKSEMTVQYIFDKIEAENIYKSFTDVFNKVISKYNLWCYPATYGIGICCIGRNPGGIKTTVNALLDSYNIKYDTEYSEAGFVYRYKISKAAANIDLLKSIS